jgi:hypothetical protein
MTGIHALFRRSETLNRSMPQRLFFPAAGEWIDDGQPSRRRNLHCVSMVENQIDSPHRLSSERDCGTSGAEDRHARSTQAATRDDASRQDGRVWRNRLLRLLLMVD